MDSPEKNPSLLSGQTAHPTTESAVASAAAPELIRLVTHEDVDRARDRWEVARARWTGRSKKFGGFRLLWLLVGPGVLVFLGENDAPSMLSYSADGSRYGVGFFIPFVVLTFVMGFIVQEMTVRLGAVTHRGHAELIFDRFGKFWGFFAMGDLVFGNFLTLVTEFIGVRAGLGFFGVRPPVAVGGALVIVVAAITTGRYWTWERITLSLAIFNGLFIPAAILARPDWHAVGHAMLTWTPFPGGNRYEILLLILATIGATVTPWMLFFQQSAVVDKGMQPRDISAGRFDTFLGAMLASVFAIAAILATVAAVSSRHQRRRFSSRPIRGSARAINWPHRRGALRSGDFRSWHCRRDRHLHFIRVRLRRSLADRAQLEPPFARSVAILFDVVRLGLRRRGTRVDSSLSARVRGPHRQRDRGSGHAARVGVSAAAGERSGSHGRACQRILGQRRGRHRRDSSDLCGTRLRHRHRISEIAGWIGH